MVAATVAADGKAASRPGTMLNSVTQKVNLIHKKFLEILIGASGLIRTDDVPV